MISQVDSYSGRVKYRVEDLARACDVSVDTVRYYQRLGLLPGPERKGRVAWYGPEHSDRIRQIRALQGKGLTLAAIKRVVTGELGMADADLAAAVARARGGEDELLTLADFAERSGVPASLVEAVEREGIGLAHHVDGDARYASGDVALVREALRILEHGLPLGELLALARDTDAALEKIAERAVELFDEHVRKPIRDTAGSDDAAKERLVEAFRQLLPAVTDLVARHFRNVLLTVAQAHIERVGDQGEVEAALEESRRMGRA